MQKNNKISTIFTKQKFENRQVFACFGVPPPPPPNCPAHNVRISQIFATAVNY